MTKQPSRIILGIDPGTTIMGYGIIDASHSQLKVISLGVIDLRKLKDHYMKLSHIYDRTKMLIEQYLPDEVALEAPFYGKNVQSMLKLGRAQGVAMAAALRFKIPIYEYAPLKVKLSITGSGSASKEQVSGMLMKMFNIETVPSFLDATDGLAVAVCHYYQSMSFAGPKKSGSWGDFVNKNKDRIL
ncbi:MAG: crossover junction endodeoxyribonuclease RuvC [Salinivirgaceae bacterium]|nr:crossover junction endodeoxyribonuclease RuvC [Salinivirgaceae bacterium]